jgi:hypothetical protein
MNQPLRRQKRRPASLWPEMDTPGTPAYDSDEDSYLGQGTSYELAGGQTVQTDRVIAVLWLPTPDNTHLQHFVYEEVPYMPEPAPRPIGFRKAQRIG